MAVSSVIDSKNEFSESLFSESLESSLRSIADCNAVNCSSRSVSRTAGEWLFAIVCRADWDELLGPDLEWNVTVLSLQRIQKEDGAFSLEFAIEFFLDSRDSAFFANECFLDSRGTDREILGRLAEVEYAGVAVHVVRLSLREWTCILRGIGPVAEGLGALSCWTCTRRIMDKMVDLFGCERRSSDRLIS